MRSLLLVLALLVATVGAAAGAPWEFPVDGWYSWQVAAVDDAPGWCCVDWNRGRSTATACDLDANDFNFGHFNFADDGSHAADEGELQVYALIRGGEAVRVRAMSPACPVESQESITELGRVEPAASLAWLRLWVRDDDSNALAAIALHRGPESLAFLTDLALHEEDKELREEAVFWLGHARIAESLSTIAELMFGDEDPDMRGEAWMWLAQTGAPESEAAIFAALREDPSADAREQAVFALPELPDQRAIDSLVKIVHDAGMDRPLREQALFWLAQSDSDEAYETIDALLSKRD